MPYSVPSVAVTAPSAAVPFPTTQGRPGHRRSFSHILAPPTLASTNSTGAFSSLGSLPTRRRAAPPKRPTFQLGKDDDDDDEDSPDESPPDDTTKLTINTQLYDDEHVHLPPLRLKSKILSSFDNQPASVPFPRSSPLPSPSHTQSSLPFPDKRSSPSPDSRPVRPVSRTSSTPILLSNGKPLKSSLKSSNSSPNIPFPPQSLVPSIMFPQLHQHSHHQRACSAPVTPHLPSKDVPSHPAKDGNESSSPPPSPLPQKNVHFPSSEEGGLTTVRVYKRSAKPASLLRIGDETETETEGESSSAPNGFGQGPWGNRWYNGRAPPYPIPKFGGTKSSPLADDSRDEVRFEIDMKNSSPVPARGAERAEGNIFFESLGFVCEAGTDKPAKPITLTGTLLVRNVSYQKTVAVRYTLDDWHTTNDVLAKHEKSLAALPERFLLASLPLVEEDNAIDKGEGGGKREVVCKPYGFEDVFLEGSGFAWDRFRFDISMERFEGSLEQRTMWFVGKYAAKSAVGGSDPTTEGSGEEWWDNNSGGNYRIEFLKKVVKDRREASPYRRNVAFSAPPVFNPSKPFPAPPQISASQSFPISLNMPQQRDHQAALAQSTLARLKRLNLMNYAAPQPLSAVARDQPFEAMETSTANTSADSTPLQTPTQDRERDFDMDVKMPVKGQRVEVEMEGHDPDVDVLGIGEGLRRTNGGFGMPMEMQNGFPATMTGAEGRESAPIEFGKGRGTGIADDSDSVSTTPTTGNMDIEMGTSPPFSSLAGMEARRFSTNPAAGLYWPWGFGAGSDEGKRGDEAELPPATPTGSLSLGDSPAMTSLKPTVASSSPAASTTTIAPPSAPAHTRTSSNSSVSNPLMPPQRRKVVNHHHHQQAQAATFSIGISSGSSSSTSPSSGSGSGSGSDTNAREGSKSKSSRKSGTASPTTTVTPKIASPQPWPLPPHYRVTSPPPSLPRRLFVPFEMRKNSQGDDGDDGPLAPSPPLSPGPGSPAQDDAVYQAFVRHWCFAQEPGPSVGAGVGVERKEDVAVR